MFVIPLRPEMSPFIPSDTKMLDEDSVICQHFSYFPTGHTRCRVAIDDDRFVGRQFAECIHYSFYIIIGRVIRIRVCGDAHCTDDMFSFVFFLATEVHEDCVIFPFHNMLSHSVWTDVDRIFHCVKFFYEFIGGWRNEFVGCNPTDDATNECDE